VRHEVEANFSISVILKNCAKSCYLHSTAQ
jgi:hypothetical protein